MHRFPFAKDPGPVREPLVTDPQAWDGLLQDDALGRVLDEHDVVRNPASQHARPGLAGNIDASRQEIQGIVSAERLYTVHQRAGTPEAAVGGTWRSGFGLLRIRVHGRWRSSALRASMSSEALRKFSTISAMLASVHED